MDETGYAEEEIMQESDENGVIIGAKEFFLIEFHRLHERATATNKIFQCEFY